MRTLLVCVILGLCAEAFGGIATYVNKDKKSSFSASYNRGIFGRRRYYPSYQTTAPKPQQKTAPKPASKRVKTPAPLEATSKVTEVDLRTLSNTNKLNKEVPEVQIPSAENKRENNNKKQHWAIPVNPW
jgi:DNA polymerase I-like protein with 3'-5' exonuclease and polymerase domains